ncbi:uncharacterized protein LOC121735046 [Aricia agestis]|uniref:uncharacterized protein LOC121735046 n=1 Tax=Aricia agestis TaxID=91739 RepID=UPI001C204FCA|nr:uncharacterized protein LOC121735046 [Aricia agestis]
MYKSTKVLEKRVLCLLRRKHVWTREKIVESPFKRVDTPNMTLWEYMWRDLSKWEKKAAVICGLTNRQYTYLEINKQSQTLGANLRRKFNIRDGDTVAVMLPNVPEYPIIAFGILSAGAVITSFNHLYTPHELQSLISLSDSKVIITLPEFSSVIQKALALVKKEIPIICVDYEQSVSNKNVSYKELINDSCIDLSILKNVRREPTDVAALLYSSGTTGLPKGVELTHMNIISNSEQQSTECMKYEPTTDSHQDTALGIFPLSHSSGFGINLFHTLSAGVKLVLIRKFQPESFVDVLEKHQLNICLMTPPTVLFLGQYPKVTAKHLQHVRYIGVGAAPIPKADIERLLVKANTNIYLGQIYGLTETSPVASSSPITYNNIISVGFALPNVSLRVVDSTMNNLGPNKLGELLIKGPNVMKGYKNNPEANANAFVNGNWLRTGDLVSIDEDGAVYVADRMRDLIKVKGFQVAPAELESLIKEIPKVLDVAVVGIKDARTGERPKAFIVINDKDIKEEEIMKYVNEKITSYKHLKEVAFVKEIPKNASGKILKRILIKEYCLSRSTGVVVFVTMSSLVRHIKTFRRLSSRANHIWSTDRVVQSPFKNVDIPDMPITEYVWKDLERWSKKTAVVCGVTDRSYTYEQVYRQSQTFGACLRKILNIQNDDVVAIMMPNVPEYPTTVLGILTAGAIATTVNPIYTAYELQKQIILSGAKIIVTIPEIVPVVKDAMKLAKVNLPIVVMDLDTKCPDGAISYKELMESNTDLSVLSNVKRSAKDIICLPYSSGTTGLPKGVEWTSTNIISNCEQQNTEIKQHNDTTESNQDTVLANLPMFHAYGLSVVLFHKLSLGLKLVTLPRFQPETFVKAFEKHKLNLFFVAPPTVLFMGFHSELTPKHLEHVRTVIVGAAPLPKPDVERFLRKVNKNVHFGQAYGLTETSPVVTMCPPKFDNYLSVGLPLPNIKLRIVDDNLNNLGPNEVGELLIHGPNVMKGYRQNEEANKQVFVDGWFRSGDMARIDEDGVVYIADRLKELIKVNAYQVAPAELESIVKEHPAVFDAAVIGVPDPKTGQKPKAFIVMKEGTNVKDQDIMDYVNTRVAPYKRITQIEFIDAIPKNPSGKILRRILAQKT